MKIWKPIQQFFSQDWLAILLVIILIGVGLAFIYSASWRGEETGIVGSWFSKQILWVTLGTLLALVLVFLDYRRLLHTAWWWYAISIVLLLLVLFVGKKVYGAHRWLVIAGIQVQPSEFAKLACILALAHYLGTQGPHVRAFSTFFISLTIVAVPFLLILKEPDLGTAMMLPPIVMMMMFVAGVRWRYLLGLIGAGLALLPPAWFLLGEYQRDRILVFLEPGRDPLGRGWNYLQSSIAVGSGGLYGKGYLNGTQNVLGFLPRTVSPSDFIFSVLAEEKGFIGASILLILFALLLMRYVATAWSSRDQEGTLLVIGLAGLLFCHVFVNIGMTIGLLPITGLPLPFISSGGSFMISTLAGFGLVQSVYVRRKRREVTLCGIG